MSIVNSVRFAFGTLALFALSAHAAVVINNSSDMNNSVFPFGAPSTATYGEAFHTDATNTRLNNFSMFLTDGANFLDFKGYIAAWDGSKVTSVLYTSNTVTAGAGGGTFSFAPNINLASNGFYIAFLSISELAPQLANRFQMPIAYRPGDTDASTDGFFFQNNGLDKSLWTSTAWSNFGPGVADVRLVAQLSEATVPEPATLALTSLALLGLAASRRRKNG